MTNVLPQQAGLTVNSVIYRYTAIKDPESGMIVYVQNEDAQGDGYIFREADDWTGIPGNTINKIVPVNNILGTRWGNGSIQWTGEGSVENPQVAYGFQYDPCFDPQVSPDCPGYKDPFVVELMEAEVVDPLDDDFVQAELDRKATLKDEEQEERDRQKASDGEKKEEINLEDVLGIVNQTLLAADAAAKAAELIGMNYIPQSYYAELPGGEIKDSVVLRDGELPKNPRAQRLGMAQQKLHKELVDSQYNNKK